jgi:hypothetical protein
MNINIGIKDIDILISVKNQRYKNNIFICKNNILLFK